MNYNNLLIENKVDAIWVTEEKNKRYLTNFSGSTCEVIIKKDKVIFITDGRYKTQIKGFIHIYAFIVCFTKICRKESQDLTSKYVYIIECVGVSSSICSMCDINMSDHCILEVLFIIVS